jgi:hypothetical protein
MSAQLEAYISAKQRAILAVLEMLAAERRLVEFTDGTTDLFAAEEALDEAAVALIAAVDDLPDDLSSYRPVGWKQEPAAVAGVILVARHRVAEAALRCLASDYAGDSASADAEAQHADELLCLAARSLAADAAADERARRESVQAAEPPLPLEWDAEAAR